MRLTEVDLFVCLFVFQIVLVTVAVAAFFFAFVSFFLVSPSLSSCPGLFCSFFFFFWRFLFLSRPAVIAEGASQASGETSSPTSAAPPRSTPLSSSAAPAKEEPSYSQSQSQSRSTSAFSSAPSTSVASSSRPLSDAPFFALSEGPLPALPSATIAMQTPLLSQTPSAQTLFLGEGHGVTASKGTPSTLYGLPENLSSLFEAMAKVEFGSLEEDERRAQGLPLSVRR